MADRRRAGISGRRIKLREQNSVGVVMGRVRDFFKRIGIFGSAGTTISNTGQRLLDLRNEFRKIGEKPKNTTRKSR